MTKERAPLSHHRAVTMVADRLGWPQVCAIVDRAERTVRRWSEPDGDAQIPLAAAVALDLAYLQAGGDPAPILAWYQLRVQLAKAAADHAMARLDAADRAAAAAKETGEAIAAQIIAHAPGAGARERRNAIRETEEAIAALGHTLPDFAINGGAAS